MSMTLQPRPTMVRLHGNEAPPSVMNSPSGVSCIIGATLPPLPRYGNAPLRAVQEREAFLPPSLTLASERQLQRQAAWFQLRQSVYHTLKRGVHKLLEGFGVLR